MRSLAGYTLQSFTQLLGAFCRWCRKGISPTVGPLSPLPAYLRPGGRVPLEARPLEARRLLHRLLGHVAVSRVTGLDLAVDDLEAEHDPFLHAPAARGVALRGCKRG